MMAAREAPETTTVAAMVNAHSHAFQRELRGAAERPAANAGRGDDFWSWRRAMYALAERLDEAGLARVARDSFSEMAACGYGAVGEFHYLHHRPDGTPYSDPNLTAKLIAEVAVEAGLRIVLLPAVYRRAGWDGKDLPPAPAQRRFVDPDVATYLERVEALRSWAEGRAGISVGVAVHSCRAVPAGWIYEIAAYSEQHRLVRHIHAAEQRRELDEVEREHGCSPIELLDRTGFLGERASVVHAIHVSDRDIQLLAEAEATVVACPTTEGNLGDGHFPALAYRDSSVRLAIGSDSQVRIDPFEEVRELETGARREQMTRFALLAETEDLWQSLVVNGLRSLGLEADECGMLELRLDHPSLTGIRPSDLGLALATCASSGAVARLTPTKPHS